jgi:DNA end-binding protein Ku
MRALWKGSVAFGLVNVPVKLYAATEDHDVRFHQVHAEDGGRIRLKRECEVCHRQLSYSEIAKGYEDASGKRIIIDPEDFENLPVPGGRDIDVVEFVPAEQIDPVLFDRTYYLEPDARSAKAYVLLREALRSTDRMAIVKVAIRQRTQLACLRIREGVLVLQTMIWPDEVREPDFDFLDNEPEVRKQELAMAESLIETMATDFQPEEFHDDYREALLAMIDAKLAGGEGIQVPAASEAAEPGQVVDLMAALRESVARSQAARTGQDGSGDSKRASGNGEAEVDVTDAEPKPRATKKTTAKRTSAKKKEPARGKHSA